MRKELEQLVAEVEKNLLLISKYDYREYKEAMKYIDLVINANWDYAIEKHATEAGKEMVKEVTNRIIGTVI